MGIFFAEFFGTLLLILLGNGAVANVLLKNSKGLDGGWIVISAGWGFGVAIAVYLCGWASGGHINPAVTISFACIHKISWSVVPYYLLGQFLGAFVGSILVYLTYYCHYNTEVDTAIKQLTFCTAPAIKSPFWNLITEIIGTSVLLFGVLGIINYHNAIHPSISPYMIGILVFSIGLSLGGPTGYAINPARDLSPRIAHTLLFSARNSNWEYAWIPIVGPLIGGIIGAFVYQWIFTYLGV